MTDDINIILPEEPQYARLKIRQTALFCVKMFTGPDENKCYGEEQIKVTFEQECSGGIMHPVLIIQRFNTFRDDHLDHDESRLKPKTYYLAEGAIFEISGFGTLNVIKLFFTEETKEVELLFFKKVYRNH